MHFGNPVSVSLLPELTSHRGKLLSGELHRGTPVHAASFLRQRRVVLETALLEDQVRLKLICFHECFHFVWPKLGNRLRSEFSALLQTELNAGAMGELGESALVQKGLVRAKAAERRWKEYCCEAFCDTGAYLYAGVSHSEDFTLAARWAERREAWFRVAIHWEVRCL